MKKILFILIGGIALVTASCTKQYNVVPDQTKTYNIQSSSWGSADGGRNDTTIINVPQIDNSYGNYGTVLVSLSFDNGQTYEPIPYVFNNVNYSYVYYLGGVELYAQSADGTQVITVPPSCIAKVTLIPTN